MRFLLAIGFILLCIGGWYHWQKRLSSDVLLRSVNFKSAGFEVQEVQYDQVSEITSLQLVPLRQQIKVTPLIAPDQDSKLLRRSAVLTILGDRGIILGHSSLPWWQHEKPVFEDLEKLMLGSTVMVDTKNSRKSYTVSARTLFLPSDPLPLTDTFPRALLLVTCYPKNATSHRLVLTLKQQTGSLRFTIPQNRLEQSRASVQ